ncbi:MAG TPA: HYR domain-containing protein, partial [Blastocatellia bacterium]|nr:HYR domain-containing protein [Blastocatellia bacterium]
GPGGSGCDNVTGPADFDPWLVLSVTATPPSVPVGGTSAIAARLTINSGAEDTSASGHVPDGTPVSFAAVNGSIFPFSATTVAGQAAATFTAACPAGPASASATVDSQTTSASVTVTDTTPPSVTCPANMTVNAPAGQCSAVVSFAPTASDGCPGVTIASVPPSGSSFPLGTTTVNVTAQDTAGNAATCSFTVTVKDVTPPAITCPANITKTSLGGACVNVTYTVPTATEACSAAPVTCSPPSGSCFPVGTTTVTCSATDASSNTGTCTFKVSVFDYCLEDDATGNRLRVSSISGAWEFEICAKGQFYSGSGQSQTSSCKIEIRPPSGGGGKAPDKTVTATINKCTNSATATIVISGKTYMFGDSNITNSHCLCN